jgi:hypothetical protein
MEERKYLVVFKGFETVVPKSLRQFVKQKVADGFARHKLDLDLDFTGARAPRDHTVIFTRDVWLQFGRTSRLEETSWIYVGTMRARRVQVGTNACEAAFPETPEALGSLIANITVHEMAHGLSLDTGGYDGAGHTEDESNYLWNPPKAIGVVPALTYTVESGDTLSGIVNRYVRGTLDPCRVGQTGLNATLVWDDEDNEQPGFIKDPRKSGVRSRRANNPDWIYPGEKVKLACTNLRSRDFRATFSGSLGVKTFTNEQVETMRKFIEQRLKEGKR